MHEARLVLFPQSFEYRFATPGWRATSAPAPVEPLFEQLRSLDGARCQRIILSGGSVLEHPRFAEIAARCRDTGVRDLAVETDGRPLAREGAAAELQALGVTTLFLGCGGVREKVYEFAMQERGTFRAAMQGVRNALQQSGLRTYVAAPLLRPNSADLEPLVDWLVQGGAKPQGFLLALPELDRVPPAARALVPTMAEQSRTTAAVFRACQGRGLEYGFTSRRGFAPCAAGREMDRFATVFHDRISFQKHAQGREYERVAACESCSLRHSCKGIEPAYLREHGADGLQPVPLDVSMNWQLRRINRLEETEYRQLSPFKGSKRVPERAIVRVNGRCNMSCPFCFADRSAPDLCQDDLQTEIRSMAAGGARHLVFSGGEPTLHENLPELVALGRDLGFVTREIQTNGVLCADESLARRLVESGLTRATVSLHSTEAAHSDSITGLPGAFGKSLKAVDNFRALGVEVQVAHVVSRMNYQDLPRMVRFLRERFPASGGNLSVCISIAQGISDLVFHWVIPTFTEIKPYMREALDYCLEHELGFGGLIGQGAYPPCMLDGDLRYYRQVLDQIFRGGDEGQHYKPARCTRCSFDSYCLGPRRSYVEHYGEDEIRPFQADLPPLPFRPGIDPEPSGT